MVSNRYLISISRLSGFAVLLFYTAMSLLSLYLMVVSSLTHLGTSFDLNDIDWIPRDWAFDNYVRFFDVTRGTAQLWFRNSLIVAFVPTTFSIFFGALAGYALAKIEFPGRDAIFWSIIGVLAIPAFVTLIPLYQMMFHFGWFDRFYALIVPKMAGLGSIFLFKQYMSTLPKDLMEAARIDGASEGTIFFQIVMPMARPVLAVMFLLEFVMGWGDYFWPYLVTNSPDLMTVQVGLMSLIGVDQGTVQPHDYGVIMAGALMASLPVIVLFLMMQKHFVRGLTIGAVKG